MTTSPTTSVQIDLAKLAAAIENTKRAAQFWRNPPCQLHLDDLMVRETLRQFGKAA